MDPTNTDPNNVPKKQTMPPPPSAPPANDNPNSRVNNAKANAKANAKPKPNANNPKLNNAKPPANTSAKVEAVIGAAHAIVNGNGKKKSSAEEVAAILENPVVVEAAKKLADSLRVQTGGKKSRKINRKRRASRSLRR
jgi:hypothetical protein